jgi:hypothetical protein
MKLALKFSSDVYFSIRDLGRGERPFAPTGILFIGNRLKAAVFNRFAPKDKNRKSNLCGMPLLESCGERDAHLAI